MSEEWSDGGSFRWERVVLPVNTSDEEWLPKEYELVCHSCFQKVKVILRLPPDYSEGRRDMDYICSACWQGIRRARTQT